MAEEKYTSSTKADTSYQQTSETQIQSLVRRGTQGDAVCFWTVAALLHWQFQISSL